MAFRNMFHNYWLRIGMVKNKPFQSEVEKEILRFYETLYENKDDQINCEAFENFLDQR